MPAWLLIGALVAVVGLAVGLWIVVRSGQKVRDTDDLEAAREHYRRKANLFG